MMNTQSAKGRKIDPEKTEGKMEVGDFYFTTFTNDPRKYIMICLPGETRIAIPIQHGDHGSLADGKPYWGWDGNEESPTLIPSIHTIDHWHGFMRQGNLVSC